MNIRANRPLASSLSGHTPFCRLAAWVSAWWQARRARQMEEKTFVSLSAIEPKLLNDIGVEMGNLHERNPHLGGAKSAPSTEDSDRRRQW